MSMNFKPRLFSMWILRGLRWEEGTWEQFKLQKQLTQSASFVIELGKKKKQQQQPSSSGPPDAAKDFGTSLKAAQNVGLTHKRVYGSLSPRQSYI